MWYFSTITSQLTLQQYFQHILNIYIRYCLQFLYPVYWLCCLYMLPLHNVIFFHNYYTIDSATMSTAYPQHIHTVMFTITLLYTGFAVYICFPFHNMIFFHNYCPINSTAMYTAYPQHIHTVLFTITLPSILTLLFTYAFLFTMWIFSTHYCTIVYMTMFTLNLHCYMLYCIQLLLPVY